MVNMTSKGPHFAHGISISVRENRRPWELWNQAVARRCKLICYNPEYYFWLSPKWKLSLAGAFWVLFWVLYNFLIFILCLLLPGKSSMEQSEKALNLESKHFGDSWYHLRNWVWFLQIAKKKKNLPKGKVCIQREKRVGIWPWSFPLRVFLEEEEQSTCKCINEINKDRNCTGCSRLERDILEERKIHFVLMICVSVSSTHFQLGSYT